MKVLAVDTCSAVASVAVYSDDGLLGEYFLNHGRTHAQKLVPMIEMLLKDLAMVPGDIDVFCGVTGPGSFTGIRIGVTTIKAMAYTHSKPVVGIPSLDALAQNLSGTGDLICPIMDARNNQVYTALYSQDSDGTLENVSGYMGVSIEELSSLLKSKSRSVTFTGDGVNLHRGFFMKELEEKCSFAQPVLIHPKASAAAELAFTKALKGETQSCFELVPFYLRKSQAERELDKKPILVTY